MPKPLHPDTLAIRAQYASSAAREHSVPLYLTSSFTFDDAEQARALFAEEVPGAVYSRFTNPNTDEFVEKLVSLEGGEDGLATATGMSAVFTALASIVKAGDHIVAGRAVFGSTHQLLTRIFPRWGVSHTYVDGDDPQAWERALTPRTRVILVESPSNPGLDLIDIEALGALARAAGIPLVVDNTFATPVLSRPLKAGAHLVVHSATKFLDGQGRTLGGAIIGDKALVAEARFLARHSGPSLSPFNAWVLSKSMETLSLRIERHSQSALAVAQALSDHPAVQAVRYPHLASHPQFALAKRQLRLGGGVLTIRLADYATATRFIDGLRLCSHSANLGDTRTIVTHPASTTHSKLTEEERLQVGITPGLIRISVGLEHVQDVRSDLEHALDQSGSAVRHSADASARAAGARRTAEVSAP